MAWRVAAGFDDGSQMLVAIAAAATDDIDAKFGNELAQCGGHWLWLHGVDGQPVDVDGDACVGNGRDGQGAMVRQKTDWFTHVFRAGGAVKADGIDAQCGQGRHDGCDICAEQHTSAGVERDLCLNRNAAPGLLHSATNTCDNSPYL